MRTDGDRALVLLVVIEAERFLAARIVAELTAYTERSVECVARRERDVHDAGVVANPGARALRVLHEFEARADGGGTELD